MSKEKPESLDNEWKCHTPNLLKEIAKHSEQPILSVPLNIFGRLLAEVGERAAELNDPRLNALMCRLTIYEIADPENPNHDPKKVKDILATARKMGKNPFTPNVPLAVEALSDWSKGKLKDKAALVVIGICLIPQPKLTTKEVRHARMLSKKLAKKLAEEKPAEKTVAAPRRATKVKAGLPSSDDGKYIVRLWDMFDGWIDCKSGLTADEAIAYWEKETKGGTERVCYNDGDYYDIFPNGTRMFMTPESLGR